MTLKEQNQKPILFFDGVCGLCNGFVDFVFRIDKKQVYQVAALQGETAKQRLPEGRINDLNTLVVLENGQEKIKSSAVLSIMANVGGIWWLLSLFRVVPRPIRDLVYDFVAKNRYGWFGQKDICRLPTASEKERFLD